MNAALRTEHAVAWMPSPGDRKTTTRIPSLAASSVPILNGMKKQILIVAGAFSSVGAIVSAGGMMSSHEYLLPDRTWDRPKGQRSWRTERSNASRVDLYLRFRREKCPGAVPTGRKAFFSLPVRKRNVKAESGLPFLLLASCHPGQSIGPGVLAGARGLLLRQAMERSQAEDEVDAVDADDLAAGEELGQGVQGDAVGGIVEGRDQDEAVGDVEVGVAGRQPLAVEDDRPGHGQGHDVEAGGRPGRGRREALAGSLAEARGSGRRRAVRRR